MSHLIYKRFATLLSYRVHSPSMGTNIKWAFYSFLRIKMALAEMPLDWFNQSGRRRLESVIDQLIAKAFFDASVVSSWAEIDKLKLTV
jgi:hypothetical protein